MYLYSNIFTVCTRTVIYLQYVLVQKYIYSMYSYSNIFTVCTRAVIYLQYCMYSYSNVYASCKCLCDCASYPVGDVAEVFLLLLAAAGCCCLQLIMLHQRLAILLLSLFHFFIIINWKTSRQAIEERYIQKKRQRSSLLFGGQNVFRSLRR